MVEAAEHQREYPSDGAEMSSIGAEAGCTSEMARRWCHDEATRRAGSTAQVASDRNRVTALEIEAKELHPAN